MSAVLRENLMSPVVLSFLLGVFARLARSDLRLPDAVFQGLSVYLLFAIGLKGGAALSTAGAGTLVLPGMATIVLGLVTPLIAYAAMRWWARLGRTDAAAVAAHFGSVSAVTFLVAGESVRRAGLDPEGYLPALVALMEVPGILVALLLARRGAGGIPREAVTEVLAGKSIVLLAGGTIAGYLSTPAQWESVQPFFTAPFKGVLCLFLLELGAQAGRKLADLGRAGWRPVALALLLPPVHAVLGVAAGLLAGLSPGGAAVLGIMAASASYIAAPAAVRIALPDASPGLYVTLSLGVVFPFNLALGIPWCLWLTGWLAPLLQHA